MFYRNGVIDVAVAPAGYPEGTYYNANDTTTGRVGFPVSQYAMGARSARTPSRRRGCGALWGAPSGVVSVSTVCSPPPCGAAGTLHDHFFSYKVDLDVLGGGGAPAANRMTVGTIATGCFNSSVQATRPQGQLLCQKEITWAPVTAEGNTTSAWQFDPATPKVFAVTNNAYTNSWGTPRGYKARAPAPRRSALR